MTRDRSSKKPRIAVPRCDLTVSQSHPGSVVTGTERSQLTESEATMGSTFWTKCSSCNNCFEYLPYVRGKAIRCNNCREVFIANDMSLDIVQTKNVGVCDTNSLVPLPKNGSNEKKNGSNEEVDATKQSCNEVNLTALMTLEPSGIAMFKKGLRNMIEGLYTIAILANAEEVAEVSLLGTMILQVASSLCISDPGLGILLEKLKEQAVDVLSCQSSVSRAKEEEASFCDCVKVANCERSKAADVLKSIEEVVYCRMQVERGTSHLEESKDTREKAKSDLLDAQSALREAKEDLRNKKEDLRVLKESMETAESELREKNNVSAKAHEKLAKAREEHHLQMELLLNSKKKWQSLCELAPGVRGWIL